MKRPKQDEQPRAWRPPTRRAFVQMLAAAAVAIQLRDDKPVPPCRPELDPLWIGHC